MINQINKLINDIENTVKDKELTESQKNHLNKALFELKQIDLKKNIDEEQFKMIMGNIAEELIKALVLGDVINRFKSLFN